MGILYAMEAPFGLMWLSVNPYSNLEVRLPEAGFTTKKKKKKMVNSSLSFYFWGQYNGVELESVWFKDC